MSFPGLGNLHCCCCPTIGYDDTAWGWPESCCVGTTTVTAIKDDVSKLSQVQVVFAGNSSTCGEAVRFNSSDYTAVGDWINNGGRLFMVAEWGNGCFGTTAQTHLTSFLSAIGSSITYDGGDYNNQSPGCSASYYSPGAANIAQGITFTGERFGKVSAGSGKTVWLGTHGTSDPSGHDGSGICVCAVEKLGSGFFFLHGDSNSGFCTGYCDFIKRIWEYADGDIL